MKVLHVEDDEKLGLTLGDFFEMIEDWEVLRASRPAAAMALLKENIQSIDVILLDIMMPPDEAVDEEGSEYGQSTGILLLARIGEVLKEFGSGRASPIPIVVLSARQDLRYLEEEGRIQKYISKTVTPELICTQVMQVVSAFQAAEEKEGSGHDTVI